PAPTWPPAGPYYGWGGPGRTAAAGGGAVGRLRGRTSRHPRRAVRRRGGGPQTAPRDTAGEAAAHGGFRAVGDGVREGALAHRHLLVGLLWQPRRGGGGRDRRRPDRHRRAHPDGNADVVDGDGLGPSGRPCRGSR